MGMGKENWVHEFNVCLRPTNAGARLLNTVNKSRNIISCSKGPAVLFKLRHLHLK